jgi:Protein of unknown function (DUF3108)
MEDIRMKKLISLLAASCFLFSCSSSFLKYDKAEDLAQNSEFEKKVKIKEVVSDEARPSQAEAAGTSPAAAKPGAPTKIVSEKSTKKVKAKASAAKVAVQGEPALRQPDIEDREGFDNARRPIVDPFHVGEKVVHSVSYFSAEAGTLSFLVKPFVEVNGRKSYNFVTEIKSSSLFSSFYSVDDQVETYVDYEQMVPQVFKLKIKESGQLKEARSYFDQKTLKANYWEKKYTEKNGHEEKKLEWDLLAFSQNAFSSVYYMRVFKWTVGKEYAFRVADDGKNIIFKAKALEKTKLSTKAGAFDAIKLKAEIVSRGALEQAGDMYMWISDDDHKYVLRIEAKIKIGTLVSEVIKITP